MEGRNIKKIIIDFDNDFLVYEFSDRGNLFKYQEIDKLALVNAFHITDPEEYMSLCKAAMFGIDFMAEKLIIYKPGSLPEKGGKMLLQEKRSFSCTELYSCKSAVLNVLGYLE